MHPPASHPVAPLTEVAAADLRDAAVVESLRWAHPIVQEWFVQRFATPTEPQIAGWPPIVAGKPTLISAPTGSGKTLAAFLVCIDQLVRKAIDGRLSHRTEVLYISPLKALSNDVQKNLEAPLAEIEQLAFERGLLCQRVRTGVRTGDTLPAERRAMLKRPPHILVTTPESLYILLTAEKSRENLRSVRTVIVDEIHAIADDKRGAHLSLSLERLDALVCGSNTLTPGAMIAGLSSPPQRIGLSATQNPIELIGSFLTGNGGKKATIVEVGKRRTMDLAVEIPAAEELGSVTTIAMWDGIYDRLAALAKEHRSTLIFVNTRRMVERLAFSLAERLGQENVAAHHGSLSRRLRLDAEQKLKNGEIRALVCTASLELGIDIGNVDLVCQIGSCRAVAAAIQRVGRAGHWRGAIPKGRLFATTRDDLVECASLVWAMRECSLDRIEIPDQPLDVLMQQIVACCAAEPWNEDDLYKMFCRAYAFRDIRREDFDKLLELLTEGIAAERGRYGAYLLRDRVHGHLQARRGARTTAISNGGTIPDTALFNVVMQPEGITIATLDEDFAVESTPGDIILLGNTSWRILRVEAAGRVLVEDAKGQPPNVPFWRGEAPQRTFELCEYVSRLRCEIAERTPAVLPGYISQTTPQVAECARWLKETCGLDDSGAEQLIGYVSLGRAVLGCVPSLETIVAERFFDEGGGMQLILHAPFGGRINKAWGLALRKRFCRGFNFELQAAATDNGLNISLAEQHSFPLSDVFNFLTDETVTELLEQASLASPIFKSRWRWSAGRSLQLLRFQKGKRIAPQVQRTRSEDLLASVFPQAAACFETIQGDIVIPDHPLVAEVMKDVLTEAMDLEGLKVILRKIASDAIRCVAVDTQTPSAFAHELLNANPYAYLDDAPLEERRARAVAMRNTLPASVLADAGRLDADAIAEVRGQAWPDVRDEHELHDTLCAMTVFPEAMLGTDLTRNWPMFFMRLRAVKRATRLRVMRDGEEFIFWVAAERLTRTRALYPDGEPEDAISSPTSEEEDKTIAYRKLVQGWLELISPISARGLSHRVRLPEKDIFQAMLEIEMTGVILRGVFEKREPVTEDADIEWCERRLLQRIHRLTLATLRKQIEAVSPAIFMRWLLGWQHLAPHTQLTGEAGLLECMRGLAGFEAPAIAWERELLPRRVANYDPRWLDQLCLSGLLGWGRLSPHAALTEQRAANVAPRAIVPTSMAPITFFFREDSEWVHGRAKFNVDASRLSKPALAVLTAMTERGACFVADLLRLTSLSKSDVEMGLWELAAAGLATADSFDSLRVLIDPRRRSTLGAMRKTAANGRWCLLERGEEPGKAVAESCDSGAREIKAAGIAAAARAAAARESAADSACRMLLERYGIVFRELLGRETVVPPWRELIGIFRRMEARGEVRGGRFVSGFSGEQFALPRAVESLRADRSRWGAEQGRRETIEVSAADVLNLVGVLVAHGAAEEDSPDRIASLPGKVVRFVNGVYEPGPGVETKISKPLTRKTALEELPGGVTVDLRRPGQARANPLAMGLLFGSEEAPLG